jgi:hypothetical protein
MPPNCRKTGTNDYMGIYKTIKKNPLLAQRNNENEQMKNNQKAELKNFFKN